LGTKFDNVYRNDLNANFDEIDKDIKAETTRAKQREDNIQAQVNTLVVNGDSSPAAAQSADDAKGVDKGNLKQRLDDDYNELSSRLSQKAQLIHGDFYNGNLQSFFSSLDPNSHYTIQFNEIHEIASLIIEGKKISLIGNGGFKATEPIMIFIHI